MRGAIKITIEGMHFPSLRVLCSVAMTRGFTGSSKVIRNRVKAGATTWAELLAPPHVNNGNLAKCAERRAKEKALMAQLCAELDARKAAIRSAA